jgi:hypothetical protein
VPKSRGFFQKRQTLLDVPRNLPITVKKFLRLTVELLPLHDSLKWRNAGSRWLQPVEANCNFGFMPLKLFFMEVHSIDQVQNFRSSRRSPKDGKSLGRQKFQSRAVHWLFGQESHQL